MPTRQDIQHIENLLDGGVRSGQRLLLDYDHAVTLLARIDVLTTELQRLADCEPAHRAAIRRVLEGGAE